MGKKVPVSDGFVVPPSARRNKPNCCCICITHATRHTPLGNVTCADSFLILASLDRTTDFNPSIRACKSSIVGGREEEDSASAAAAVLLLPLPFLAATTIGLVMTATSAAAGLFGSTTVVVAAPSGSVAPSMTDALTVLLRDDCFTKLSIGEMYVDRSYFPMVVAETKRAQEARRYYYSV